MKFFDILKNKPEEPPPPGKGQGPPPGGAPRGAPAGAGFRLSGKTETQEPREAAESPGVFGSPDPQAAARPPEASRPAPAPKPAEKSVPAAEIAALYADFRDFFARAAEGTPAQQKDAERLLQLGRLLREPDYRLLAKSVQDRGCVSEAGRALHVFIFSSYLLRELALDAGEASDLLIASLAGAPPAPQEGAPVERELEKAEAFKIAALFHGLIHPHDGSPGLRPEQAAAALVERRSEEFNPKAVRRFINEFSLYPPGSVVRLSNGKLAAVIAPHAGFPTRPTVEILEPSAAPGQRESPAMDLRQHPLIRIDPLQDPSRETTAVKRRRRRTHMGWNILGF